MTVIARSNGHRSLILKRRRFYPFVFYLTENYNIYLCTHGRHFELSAMRAYCTRTSKQLDTRFGSRKRRVFKSRPARFFEKTYVFANTTSWISSITIYKYLSIYNRRHAYKNKHTNIIQLQKNKCRFFFFFNLTERRKTFAQ